MYLKYETEWKGQMKSDVVTQNTNSDALHGIDVDLGGQVSRLTESESDSHGEVSILAPEGSLPAVDPALLKFDQF